MYCFFKLWTLLGAQCWSGEHNFYNWQSTLSEDDCITVYSTFGIVLVLKKKFFNYAHYIFLCLTLNPSWGPCIGHGFGSTRIEQRTTQKNGEGGGLDEVRLEDAGINWDKSADQFIVSFIPKSVYIHVWQSPAGVGCMMCWKRRGKGDD